MCKNVVVSNKYVEYSLMDMMAYFADSVKSDELGNVRGYLVRFGSPNVTDLEGDYFTKSTDFGFPLDTQVPINLYYHHGMDAKVGKRAIGKGTIKADEVGLWYQAQIDMSDEYGQMIAKLSKQGRLGYSSGAASHLVERKQVGGAHEVLRWPIAEASLTPTPAEPMNMVKSVSDIAKMYMDKEMGEGEMEEEEPEPEVEVEPPAGDASQWAKDTFSGSATHTFHETVEALYEVFCTAVMQIGAMPGSKLEYINALVDEFANQAKQAAVSMDAAVLAKSLQDVRPDTVRTTEGRLRDAFGLSRTASKRLAPLVFEAFSDKHEDEAVSNTEVDTRERLNIKLNLLRMKARTNEY